MLFRIDIFSVPAAAREKFLARSARTMALLEEQPGFVRGQLFEKVGDPGAADVITMVAWRDQESVEAAGAAVRAMHELHGFDPVAFGREHGIVESKALYASRPPESEA